MFGWLKKKATQLQISNTKTDLKILDLSTKNVRLEEVFVNLIKDN